MSLALTETEFRARLVDKGVTERQHRGLSFDDLWRFYRTHALLVESKSHQRKLRQNAAQLAKVAQSIRTAVRYLRDAQEFLGTLNSVLRPWAEYNDLNANGGIETAQEIVEWQSEHPAGERSPLVIFGDLKTGLLTYADRIERQYPMAVNRRDDYSQWFRRAWADLVKRKTGGRNSYHSVGARLYEIVFDCIIDDDVYKALFMREKRRRSEPVTHTPKTTR